MLDTVRARLTLWYVSLLAAILVVVLVMIYVLLARALYVRIDDSLQAVVQICGTSLANDLAEGQNVDDAARSTAARAGVASASGGHLRRPRTTAGRGRSRRRHRDPAAARRARFPPTASSAS